MNAEVSKLVDSLPEGGAPSPGEHPSPHPAVVQLAELGPAVVGDLVDLLQPPEKGGDARARLGLHHLTTYMAGQSDDARKAFATALAKTIQKDRDADVAAFVIRQLQLVGGPEVIPALGALATDETLCDPACMALVAIGDGASAPLLAAADKATGRPKLVVLHSLAALREPKAAPALRTALADDSREVRLVAAWGLSRVGTAEDAAPLLALARREEGYARAKVIDACFDLAERLGAARQATERAQLLRQLRDLGAGDHVSEAADRLLAAAS